MLLERSVMTVSYPNSRAIEEAPRRFRNLFLAGAALLVLAGCEQAPSRPPCPEGKVCLMIGNTNEPATLDPHKSTGTWEDRIQSDIFMGLAQSAADGTTIPGVAERWESSADGLTWTFHLRESYWSDGVPVTADDFVFSLRRVLDPNTASEYASLIYLIKNAKAVNEGKAPLEALGVRAVDARTLEISLEDSISGATRRIQFSDGRMLDVAIPKGAGDGQVIRLKGQGAPGRGGPAGDALIELKIAKHPLFTRDGADLTMDQPVALYDAVLGGKIPVRTPEGTVMMTIPKGSSSGKVLRLKGRGAFQDGRRGDLLAKLMIVLPEGDERLTKLAEAARDEGPIKPFRD